MILEAIKSIFPYQAILVIALIISGFNFKRLLLKSLFLWLLFTCLIEIFVSYYFMIKYKTNFYPINLFSFSTIYYFSFLFIPELKNKKIKTILVFCLLIWSVFAVYKVINLTYQSPIENHLYLVGLIIIMLVILAYLREIIAFSYVEIKSNPKTILAISLLMFITCSFPVLAFLDYFLSHPQNAKAFTDILDTGNIILSLGYLGAALCIKKIPPSTTSS